MIKNKTTLIMILLFFVGLSVLLYPSLSSFYNKKVQSEAIVDYEAILKNKDDNEYDEMFEDAESYNTKLSKLKDPFITYKTIKNYDKLLNLNETGMMGYISINKIKVELPIYHGTSKEVLSKAVGHLEGSSLPIGGLGTHSVLSAHRGLPSSTLFTNLDKLEIGDTFTIKVLNRELTYQVDNIEIVKPSDIKSLKIDENKDYVTLMTCTPYGINTHRLLVRGVRIEDAPEKKFITTEAFKISNYIVMPLVAIPIILILLIIVMVKPIKSSNRKIKEKYIYPSRFREKNGGNKNDKKS